MRADASERALPPKRIWFRCRLDLHPRDVAGALACCLWTGGRASALRRLEATWGGERASVACLSLRSGFDLLLRALDLPAESEVLLSAVTIPDMSRIVAAHGLVPVPLDVDPVTCEPRPDALRAALSERTRIVVVAHLFGEVFALDELARLLVGRDVLLVEDCAQAFAGVDGYRGHPRSDVVLFSFGPIKTATALGGGNLDVRDAGLAARLQSVQDELPVQTRAAYLGRLAKLALMGLLTGPFAYALLSRVGSRLGLDIEALLLRSSRSFPSGDLLRSLRRRPSTALLRFLVRRLRGFDRERLRERARLGRAVHADLAAGTGEAGLVLCPPPSPAHSFWLFPLLADARDELKQHLLAHGFDASEGHSLDVVPSPTGRGSTDGARRFLERVLFLPVYPGLPDRERARLAERTLAFARDASRPAGADAGPSTGEARAPAERAVPASGGSAVRS